MTICYLCNKQTEKSKYGSAHTYLQKNGEQRNFAGTGDEEGYFEQDYRCTTCKSKLTLSTEKINLAWHLQPSDGAADTL